MRKYFDFFGDRVQTFASMLLRQQGVANMVGIFFALMLIEFILVMFI